MPDIDPLASLRVPPQSATPAPEGGGALEQDAFLKLLTTQLQNQDPTEPISNEDFIAQLAQFSSLEALMGLQGSMDAVYMGIAAMNNASMANLLGTEVVAEGNEVHVSGEGDVPLHFDASADYEGGTVTVQDAEGRVVATLSVEAGESGETSVVWDGLDTENQPVEEGVYTFKVKLSGSDGSDVEATSLVVGTVDEMDYTSGSPRPSIDGIPVGIEVIRRLKTGTGS